MDTPNAALPSLHRTQFHVGYTDQALFIGFRGDDANPDSLVVTRHTFDEGGWKEDLIELFLDTNFDHRSYGQVSINSIGILSDEWIDDHWRNTDTGWDPAHEVAAHVGVDFWSVEYSLLFKQPNIAKPQPGSMWGFNAARTYRATEYNQWVRTFFNAHSPDDFGILLFR